MTTQSNPRPSQPIGTVLVHIGTDFDASLSRELDRWSEQHILDNMKLPGFVSARRLRRVGPASAPGAAPDALTLYELADSSALETREYTSRKVELPPSLANGMRFTRALYRAVGAAPGASTQEIGPAILHVTVDVEPAWRARFVDWYAAVHVTAVLSAPGMLGARRFENAALASGREPAAGEHAYCTLYEMEDAGVLARPSTVEAASKGACPPELAPHRVPFNHVYEEIFRATAR